MSYDLSIGDAEFNVTYNLGPMFRLAHSDGIRATYGMTGRDAVPVWRDMRLAFEDRRAEMVALEPENGWGDYGTAWAFINEAIMASIKNPDDVWSGD